MHDNLCVRCGHASRGCIEPAAGTTRSIGCSVHIVTRFLVAHPAHFSRLQCAGTIPSIGCSAPAHQISLCVRYGIHTGGVRMAS